MALKSVIRPPLNPVMRQPLSRGFASGLPNRADLITYLQGASDGLSFKQSGRTSKADAVRGTVLRGDGSGSGAADILTTDTITAGSVDVPTCTVDGTVTFADSTDYWDVKVYRSDVLIADWHMINKGETTEFDWSGNDNHLVLSSFAGDAIVEVSDGTGSDRVNLDGYSERENLLKYSEDFSNSYWFKSELTVSGSLITETTSTTKHQISQQLSPYTTGSIAFMAKSNGRSISVEKSGWGSTSFNLSDGSIISGTGTITDIGGGWYYCTASYTASSAQSFVYIILMTHDGAVTYEGDGTSGAYIEDLVFISSLTPGGYIQTTSTPITGRQPANFQGITDYPGPLSSSALISTKACLQGDGAGYATITGLLTTDTITSLSTSVPTCTTNGRMDFASGEDYSGITVTRGGETWAYYPCENGHPTLYPNTTWLQDVVGGNHAVLTGFTGDPYSTCEVTADNPSYYAVHGGSADYDGNDGLTLATNGIMPDDSVADYKPNKGELLANYPGTLYFRDPLMMALEEFTDEAEFMPSALEGYDDTYQWFIGLKGFTAYSTSQETNVTKIDRVLDLFDVS